MCSSVTEGGYTESTGMVGLQDSATEREDETRRSVCVYILVTGERDG